MEFYKVFVELLMNMLVVDKIKTYQDQYPTPTESHIRAFEVRPT